jgi:multiple sugar transport system permease protein
VETLQPNWLPREPTFENFTSIFNDPSIPVLRWFVNSLGVATAFTALVVLIDSLAGYAYARMQFPGRDLLFGLLLATLVMPGIMFLVPNYITIARLNWLNTYQGVIAPGLSGVFGVFFLRQFFQSIPRELEEAAYIDGASVLTTFVRVALPLAKGAIATLGIITFLTSWNDFLWPLLILNARDLQTLPVGLATIQGQYTFDYGKLMAGAVVTAVPVLILYIFLQRYIIQNVAMTGLKG